MRRTRMPDTNTLSDFDLDSLRLKQDFNESLGVQKMLTHVPVRKPNRTNFIRVHPGEDYKLDVGIVELKESQETFLIMPTMMQEPGVYELVQPARIVTYINRQSVLALWPLKLERDGKLNPWHKSALDAAGLAEKQWISIRADMSLGAYQIFAATAELPEPEWPEQSGLDPVAGMRECPRAVRAQARPQRSSHSPCRASQRLRPEPVECPSGERCGWTIRSRPGFPRYAVGACWPDLWGADRRSRSGSLRRVSSSALRRHPKTV